MHWAFWQISKWGFTSVHRFAQQRYRPSGVSRLLASPTTLHIVSITKSLFSVIFDTRHSRWAEHCARVVLFKTQFRNSWWSLWRKSWRLLGDFALPGRVLHLSCIIVRLCIPMHRLYGVDLAGGNEDPIWKSHNSHNTQQLSNRTYTCRKCIPEAVSSLSHRRWMDANLVISVWWCTPSRTAFWCKAPFLGAKRSIVVCSHAASVLNLIPRLVMHARHCIGTCCKSQLRILWIATQRFVFQAQNSPPAQTLVSRGRHASSLGVFSAASLSVRGIESCRGQGF